MAQQRFVKIDALIKAIFNREATSVDTKEMDQSETTHALTNDCEIINL